MLRRLSCLIVICSCGCTNKGPAFYNPPLEPELASGYRKKYTPKGKDEVPTELNAVFEKYRASTPEKKVEIRNELLGELMTIAKDYHRKKLDLVYTGVAAKDVVFDSIQLASTAFASVAGAAEAKAIAAAIATGTKGLQLSLDRNFFENKAKPALISAMRADAAVKERVLRDGMTKTAALYPLDVALQDWVDFLYAGNLNVAFEMLQAEAQKMDDKAQSDLRNLSPTNTPPPAH